MLCQNLTVYILILQVMYQIVPFLFMFPHNSYLTSAQDRISCVWSCFGTVCLFQGSRFPPYSRAEAAACHGESKISNCPAHMAVSRLNRSGIFSAMYTGHNAQYTKQMEHSRFQYQYKIAFLFLGSISLI